MTKKKNKKNSDPFESGAHDRDEPTIEQETKRNSKQLPSDITLQKSYV